jgi:hypothetical protein
VGIYNADIQFRNSIKIKKRGRDTFEMVDFDDCSGINTSPDPIFEIMKRIFALVLDFDIHKTKEVIEHIFRKADGSVIEEAVRLKNMS